MYAVDGGSKGGNFVEDIRKMGAIVLPEAKRGIANSQKQAIVYAAQDMTPDTYVLLEPEKAGLLRDSFGHILAPVKDGLADIVLVGRSDASMKTMTRMQRLTETKINEIISGITGIKADYCMAPRVWNAGANPHFVDYTPTRNWDLFHGPFIDAMAAGKKVTPVSVDFTYPADMIAQEKWSEPMGEKKDRPAYGSC